MDDAFKMVKTRGTVVTIGTFNEPISINPFFSLSRREIRLQSAMGRNWTTWRRMMQLVESDKLKLAPLVDRVLPIERFDEGFELVKGRRVQKVLLRP
jgi:threonine dehydrogenase-like Zn-dependent dehydrogenase